MARIDTSEMTGLMALQQAFGGAGYASQLGNLTAQSNLNSFGLDQALADRVNASNLASQNLLNVGNLPGGAGLQNQAVSDALAQLAGRLSPGTVQTIQDYMAQLYGAGSGFGADSNSISAAAMRVMGLTAEGQVQAGMGNLGALNAMYPRPSLYGVQSGFVTPSEYANLAMAQANLLARRLSGDNGTGTPAGTTSRTSGGGGGGSGGGSGGGDGATVRAQSPAQYSAGASGGGQTPGQIARGLTGVSGINIYDIPMTGSWIDNGDGTYTQSNSGVMSQFDPSIVNTGYNPINDTAYNTGSVYDSYGNYNPGYGSGLGGTFDATYYDPTATASAWGYGNTEGGTALQNYWLGANQDWSSPLGASSYGTSSPYDWSMTDGASTPYYDAPIYSNGYDSGYTDLGSFEDWSDYYGTTRAALSTSGRAKANSYQSNDLIYFMYPEVGRYWARTEEILTDARTIVVGD